MSKPFKPKRRRTNPRNRPSKPKMSYCRNCNAANDIWRTSCWQCDRRLEDRMDRPY